MTRKIQLIFNHRIIEYYFLLQHIILSKILYKKNHKARNKNTYNMKHLRHT